MSCSIIAEMMRALHQAAAVIVSHGPTIAPRLDKNSAQGQSKPLVVVVLVQIIGTQTFKHNEDPQK